MAVIADYVSDTGCRITVHDDCIQPPDEVERIIERVSKIVINEERRKAFAAQKAKEGPA